MADLQYTVQVETSQVNRNLDNLNMKVDKLTNKFSGLQSAIAGLAIGAAIGNAIRFADAINDISDSTGIAIENINGFSRAVELNGGSAQDASNGILKLVQTIGQAAEGSAEAQNAFRQVGVSLEDLRTLSEQDLLTKTIQGLGKVDDVSKRAVLSTELLGKAFRGINIQGVAGSLAGATAASAQYSSSIRQAADLQDKLDRAIQQVQLSLLKAIEPLLNFMNKLDSDKVGKMIDAVIQLAAQIGALAAAIYTFEKIGKAILFVAGAFAALYATFKVGAGQILTSGASIKRTFDIMGAYIDRFRRGTPMFDKQNGAVKNLTTLISKLSERFIYLNGGIAGILKGLAKMIPYVGAVYTAFELLNSAIKTLTGNSITEWVGKGIDKVKEFLGIAQKANDSVGGGAGRGGSDAITKQLQERGAELAKQSEEVRKVTDAFAKQKLEIQGVTDAFARQNAQVRNSILLEAALQGLNLQTQETIRAQTDIYARMQSEIDKLQDKKSKLTDKEQELIPVIDEQIKKLRERADVDSQAAATAITNAQGMVNANKLVTFSLEQQNQIQNQVADIQDQIAMVTLPELEKRYYAVEAAARAAARAQIQAEETRRGTKLTPEEAKAYYDAASKGSDELKGKQTELLGVQEKMNARQFQIQNENRVTQQMIDLNDQLATLTMPALEKKYYDIEKAAKASALAEIQSAEARLGRKLSTEEAQKYYDAASQGTDQLKQKTTELYEKSRTFETGWKQAFNTYVEDATNAATRANDIFNSMTSNMNSALDKFVETGKFSFGDLANSIIKDIMKIELKAAAANLFKALGAGMGGGGGGLFGGAIIPGFLADGGPATAGKPYVVGEEGPELFVPKGSGTVIPNDMMGSGQAQPVVYNITNNVSAVDAQSVARLFANNRQLMLGTIEQARKELPIRQGRR